MQDYASPNLRLVYIGLGDSEGYTLTGVIGDVDAAILDTETGIVYVGHMSGGTGALYLDVATALANGEIPDA